MENFIRAFHKDGDGSWLCIQDVTLNGPGGRIQVTAGTRLERGRLFMGVDLARFLDAQAGAGAGPGT